MRYSLGPPVFVLALCTLACGSEGASNVTGPTPPSVLSSIQLIGNTDLTAIGQTSQLTLNARYTDGSTKDVSAEAVWTSTRTRVVTVNKGMLTTSAFGLAAIVAQFSGKSANVNVIVAPDGAFVVDGRVREPGSGSLSNVPVVEQTSGTDTKTDSAGSFQLFSFASARIRIEQPDYEVFERDVLRPAGPSRTTFLDAPLQRVVRISAGQSRGALVIAPNDVSYQVGADLCNPCKLIRAISGGPTTLTLRMSWTGAGAGALKLWADGNRNSTTGSNMIVNVPTAGGQSLIYVGWTQPAGSSAPQYAFVTFSVD